MEEEKSNSVLIVEALDEAAEAFRKYFEDRGCDAAYFDYRFTVWEVDDSLTTRLARVEIEREVKE